MKRLPNLSFRLLSMAVIALGLAACLDPYPLPPPGTPRPGPPMPGPPGPPMSGAAFSRTGTVTRHAPFDTCMEGNVNYDLHAGGRTFYRLSAHGSHRDIEALERAVRSGAPVHVTGVRRRGARPECDYIVVTRVSPAWR